MNSLRKERPFLSLRRKKKKKMVACIGSGSVGQEQWQEFRERERYPVAILQFCFREKRLKPRNDPGTSSFAALSTVASKDPSAVVSQKDRGL